MIRAGHRRLPNCAPISTLVDTSARECTSQPKRIDLEFVLNERLLLHIELSAKDVDAPG